MAILGLTGDFIGLVGVNPSLMYMRTNDTLATVIQPGYVPKPNYYFAFPISEEKIILANTSDKGLVWLQPSIENNVVTLNPLINPGTVLFPVIAGNLASYSNTDGQLQDSGIASSNVQLKSSVKVATSGNIGGSGAGPIDIAITGVTSSSIAVADIASSSNAVQILKVVPGSNKISITFSGDPGASAVVKYIVYYAGQ